MSEKKSNELIAKKNEIVLLKRKLELCHQRVKRTEEEVLTSIGERKVDREDLLQQGDSFHVLLNNIPGFFFRVEHAPEWPVVHFSRGMEELAGYPSEDFVNMTRKWIDYCYPEDLDYLINTIAEATDKKEVFDLEYRFIHASGQVRWCREIGIYLDRGKDKVPYLDGYVFDIQEHKTLEASLKLAVEQAETANRAKSEFLANMSHELRTPLNAVLGFSDILSEQIVDPKQKKFINHINTAGSALLSLINNILDLSKIETGKAELGLEATSIRKLFDEMASIFEWTLEQKGIKFSATVDSSVPEYLLLDTNRVREILLNLCSNASKFTNDGQISILANAYNKSQTSDSMDLKLDIIDTGKGIAKDDFERIFKPFEQSSRQKISEYGGTGLGLSITHKLVEMMAGKIELKSEIGKGSHFTIILPRVKSTSNGKKSSQRLVLNYEAIVFAPATLLVVDDISYNREIIVNYLKQWPFTILQADNGLKALELCKSENIDLILLDMKMPVMDGYEASKHLKSNPKTADIPIIAISASALKREVCKILENCDLYLAKPLMKTVLVESLMEVLEFTQDEALITSSTERQIKEQSDDNALVTRLKEGDEEKNKIILIVDDEKLNRELFHEVIEGAGYTVVVACDGVEGLEMIAQYHPELILLDQNMPNMNGLEMLRQLKTIEQHIPKTVLMSADTSTTIADTFVELGVCGIINKPVSLTKLLERISEILSTH